MGSGANAFLWTEDSGFVALGTLGGSMSTATAVNDGGQVVGASTAPDNIWHAFAWTAGSGMVDLGRGGALAISDNGHVVGEAYTDDDSQPFSWTEAGGLVGLGNLGGSRGVAWAVNESGQVVGFSYTAGETFDTRHAFSWTPAGGIVDLGTLGGSWSEASDVSESGAVVGGSDRAFLWTEDSGMIDLGTLGGSTSWARAINDSGLIVGRADTASGETHAALWYGLGADELITDLIALVESYNLDTLGASLTAKLANVQRLLEAGKPTPACQILDAFVDEVEAQTGKSLTSEQAAELIAAAERIRDVIGCEP